MNFAKKKGLEKEELVRAVIATARNGLTSHQLSVTIKYKDPDNPHNVWSGRGRMPLWLSSHIKKGKELKDFLAF